MPLGQIDGEQLPYAEIQFLVDGRQALHHIVMDGGFAHAENLSRLADGRTVADDKFRLLQHPCVDIVKQRDSSVCRSGPTESPWKKVLPDGFPPDISLCFPLCVYAENRKKTPFFPSFANRILRLFSSRRFGGRRFCPALFSFSEKGIFQHGAKAMIDGQMQFLHPESFSFRHAYALVADFL